MHENVCELVVLCSNILTPFSLLQITWGRRIENHGWNLSNWGFVGRVLWDKLFRSFPIHFWAHYLLKRRICKTKFVCIYTGLHRLIANVSSSRLTKCHKMTRWLRLINRLFEAWTPTERELRNYSFILWTEWTDYVLRHYQLGYRRLSKFSQPTLYVALKSSGEGVCHHFIHFGIINI